MGLNPSGKQAFLKFLLDKSKEKQIFISTHDSTFVNPLLWDNQGVAVYLHSVAEKKFVRVNLKESENDPNTFAGYLPHTTSLKQIHIYVEGSLDVYIFQIFLEKYLKATFVNNWYEIMNRIGIYHLGGNFWNHLLYTIPDKPYCSIVILDGDKSSVAPGVIKEYDSILKNRFKFFSSVNELTSSLFTPRPFKKGKRPEKEPEQQTPMPIPVCCLKKTTIEDYLDPKPPSKKNGPIVAQQMNVPNEIADIFSAVVRLAKIENHNNTTPNDLAN